MPRFSVIIPAYNRERLLRAAVESVRAQRERDFEVIVVDDGSSDGTVATARELAAHLPLRVIQQANSGPGPARNRGAAEARGEYLCFLDSDDLWFPWTLEFVRGVLDRAGQPALLASMPRAFADEGDLAGVLPPREGLEVVERYADYLAADPVSIFPGAGSMVVRAEAFARSGGFGATRMGAEDAELFLRLGVEPGFVFVRRPALVAYRAHRGSFSVDVGAGLRGRWEMMRLERAGRFPGGAPRRRERRAIITSHCRSGTIVAVRAGQVGEAARLYAASLAWNASLGRWKYLLGFPLMALRAMLRGSDARAEQGFLPAMPGGADAATGSHRRMAPAQPDHPRSAAVVMATRNRREELARAIRSCLAQTVPVEIVVRDDGSTDGTEEMVRRDFPMVDYARHEQARGSIVSRNQAVAAARAEIIFSIDDDAALDSPRTVEQTLAEFDDPRVGIVAIPFIDVLKGDQVEQRAPGAEGVWVLDTFRGCAAAWRRSAFLEAGGYASSLVHMAEEPDLALRMLDRGLVVRAGRADPVHHFESPNRSWDRIWRQIARNGVLQGWMTAPWFMLPVHLVGTLLSSVRTGLRVGRPGVLIAGAAEGLAACRRAPRRAVSARTYFLCRWLRRHKPARLAAIQARLPALQTDPAPAAYPVEAHARPLADR